MQSPCNHVRQLTKMMRLAFVLGLAFCPCISIARADEPWIRHTIDDSSRGADGIRLADVNSDGRMDIATGWEEGGKIRVYLQPESAKTKARWPSVTVGNVESPEDAVFVDLDRDGAIDLVSSCEGKNRTMFVHWAPKESRDYLNPNSWQTERIPATTSKQSWMFALPMQVDGQRGVDIIVGSKGSDAMIGWLQSPSDPRLIDDWKWRPIIKAGWIMSLQTHDMDMDGDLDVLVSDRKGPTPGVLWLENLGAKKTSTKRFDVHRIGSEPGEFMFLTTGDLDDNGQLDILCTQKDHPIYRYERGNDHDDWMLTKIPLPNDCGSGKGVAVADVDLDGRNDIVFSCEHANGEKSGMRWLSASGTAWNDHEISGPIGVKFDRIEMLDLDSDGDLDVITCEERANLGVIWYENPTN